MSNTENIAEDNTLDIAYDPKNQIRISNEEWFEISQNLEPFHAVFYKLWQMGKPKFNEEISTAAVQFDENGGFIWFHFNPHFWKRLQLKDKLFVICHEALHVILNHGIRTKNSGKNRQATNVALDVVVNHSLVNNFGFERRNIEDWQEYCWIDTVFKDRNPKPPENETYEYYYNLFDKVYGDGGMGDGDGESGPTLVDDHNMLGSDSDDWGKVIDELNKSLSAEEKKSLEKTIDKHFQKTDSNTKAGTGTGQWSFANVAKVKKKKKWETVIKKWSKKYILIKDKDEEQWARLHRRLSMLSRNMFLPSDMEVDESDYEKTRIDVWFYLDTSGSCWDLKDRFFTAAMTLPPERFNIRLFCFDTEVKETTLESKKVYGGGGTSFKILEAEIQNEIKQGKIKKYPEAVFVITDGYGDTIKPEKPSNWYWFITSGGNKNCIQKDCNFYNLNDFE
jgi:predicted metal-dependent peptidase